MSDVIDQRECLNCGAPLGGKYCGRCGQRNIGAYPSGADLFANAWQELTRSAARLVRTIGGLRPKPPSRPERPSR